jgi:hypothetical protein
MIQDTTTTTIQTLPKFLKQLISLNKEENIETSD